MHIRVPFANMATSRMDIPYIQAISFVGGYDVRDGHISRYLRPSVALHSFVNKRPPFWALATYAFDVIRVGLSHHSQWGLLRRRGALCCIVSTLCSVSKRRLFLAPAGRQAISRVFKGMLETRIQASRRLSPTVMGCRGGSFVSASLIRHAATSSARLAVIL